MCVYVLRVFVCELYVCYSLPLHGHCAEPGGCRPITFLCMFMCVCVLVCVCVCVLCVCVTASSVTTTQTWHFPLPPTNTLLQQGLALAITFLMVLQQLCFLWHNCMCVYVLQGGWHYSWCPVLDTHTHTHTHTHARTHIYIKYGATRIQFYFACIVRCIGLCHYYQGEHNNSEKPEKREKAKD